MKRIVTQKKKKNAGAYTPELRAFASTLKYYSSKAYKFVRKSFALGLPHPSVILYVHGTVPLMVNQDLPKAVFAALSAKVMASKKIKKDVICSLMIDEMSIRKHVIIISNSYIALLCMSQSALHLHVYIYYVYFTYSTQYLIINT